MSTTRKLTVRLALTIMVLVVGLLGVAAAPASAAPEPSIEGTAKPEVLRFQQYRNRINFSWWLSTSYSVASYTVDFEGLSCTVPRSGNDYRCTIFQTANRGGTASLSKNMTNGTVVEVDSVEIEALGIGECGAAYTCPSISVTQFPNEVHFRWTAFNRSGGQWVLHFADQSCRFGHGRVGWNQTYNCVIRNTNDAGGVVTLSYLDRYVTETIYNEIAIEPLGPGKCGATPRCVDAPINFAASTNGMTAIDLDWQNHDGTERSGAGYKVQMKPKSGGSWTAVCPELLRTTVDYPSRGLADSACVVSDLAPGTGYDFRVASNGGGRASGMWVEASAATQQDLNFEHYWRAETNGTLYIGFTWDTVVVPPRHTLRVGADFVGNCGRLSSNSCEIRVSKATGDALPNTFEARMTMSADHGSSVIQTMTATPPPDRPRDPANLQVDASKTTATVSWDHPRKSTAVRYGVWLSGPGLPTCEVTQDLGGRESCRLTGLTPGTNYRVHVFGEDAIGQRSETPSITFVTNKDAERPKDDPKKDEPKNDEPKVDPKKDEPKKDEPKVDPKVAKCAADGQYTKTRDRIVKKVNGWYEKQVNKATDRLDDKPKKLARKISKLETRRDNKIAKAEARYIGRCG